MSDQEGGAQTTARGYRNAQVRAIDAAIRRTQQAMGETNDPGAQARLGAMLQRQTLARDRVAATAGGVGAGRRGVRLRNMTNNRRRRAGVAGTSRQQRALRNYIASRRATAAAVGAPSVAALNASEGIGQNFSGRGRRRVRRGDYRPQLQ